MSFSIQSEKLKLQINQKGAELASILDLDSKYEFLWQANPAVWNRHAPVLFPIVGKVNQNKIKVDGQSFGLNQHGFARDLNFEMVEIYQDTLRMMLVSDENTKVIYPYDFKFFITYEVFENNVKVTYTTINTGENNMYFSVGAHPGFQLPVANLSDYTIIFKETENLNRHLLKEGLFTGETEQIELNTKELPLNLDLFLKDAIVFKELNSRYLELKQKDSNFKIGLEFTDFPHLGIWAKYPCQEFICLEPWVGFADATDFTGDISEKEGIIQLGPGSENNVSYTLSFFGQ